MTASKTEQSRVISFAIGIFLGEVPRALFLLEYRVIYNGADNSVGEDDGELGFSLIQNVGIYTVIAVLAVSGFHRGLGGTDIDALGGGDGVIGNHAEKI